MTRVIGWLVGMGIIAAGCQETTQELPAATELGSPVMGVQVIDDVAYWVERSQGGPSVRLRRYQAGVTDTVDEMQFDAIPDYGWPMIAASATAAVWGFGNPLLGGCIGRSVKVGNAGDDLGLYAAHCPIQPLALRDSTLTFLTARNVDDIAVARADLVTSAIEEMARIPGEPGGRVLHGDHAYLLLTRGPASAQFTVIAALDLRAPDAPMEIVSAPIAGQRLRADVFTVGDGWLAWLDDRSATADAWRVVVRTDAGDAITELPQPAHSLAAAGGALWMIADDLEDVERARLLRIPDIASPVSSPSTLTLGAEGGARALTGFGDALLVETNDFRLLLQPLP